MRVTVRLFARLRDLASTGELVREVPDGALARDVWNDLVLEWPGLREYEKTMSVAVNTEYARMSTEVHDGDEIAFMPPVSGGAGERCSTSC
jgi:molybdopterin converting factor subunit 1